jgi:hypothetical protein
MPLGARAKLMRTHRGPHLKLPERGASVWPPLPPLPEGYPRPEAGGPDAAAPAAPLPIRRPDR